MRKPKRAPGALWRASWTLLATVVIPFPCSVRARELMTEHYPDSAMYRWQQKPVVRRLVLDDMEGDTTICRKVNLAELTQSSARAHSGTQSLLMRLPIRKRVKGGKYREGKANYGFGGIAINDPALPWSRYNRFSCWVYAQAPGLDQLGLTLVLKTGYDEMTARTRHTVNVKEGTWCQLLWEFDHIPRDKTTGITVTFGLSGREPEAEHFVFYFDDIELQQVEPDLCESWEVRPDAFAFSHTGYLPESVKRALASGISDKRFHLIDPPKKIVFTGPVRQIENRLGKFQLLDFTPFADPGEYCIQAGDRRSRPFRIGPNVWDRTIQKVINFYFQERCGFAVPGVHGVCHTDVFCEANGKRIRAAAGAWHDAGDLSVPGSRCAESAYAMLQLVQSLRRLEGYESLAERVLEEAVWGLDWILRTSFRDGNRSFGGKIGFYTDGIDDNYDDVYFKANARDQFFLYAAVEAVGARLLEKRDPAKARTCLEMAREDYGYGMRNLNRKQAQRYGRNEITAAGQGIMAACDLHDVTGEARYLKDAVRLARLLLPYQIRRKPEGLRENLCGYFVENIWGGGSTIRTFGHQAADIYCVEPFIRLCKKHPDHPDWIDWYSSVVLFSEYYLKRLCAYTAPYCCVPNGLYDIKFWKQSKRHADVAQYLPFGQDMGGGYYVRMFTPTLNWNFRGNTGTALSQTRAMSGAGVFRGDKSLVELAKQQVHWTVGMNPFSSSLMWGEGYDYTPYFTPQVGDIVGALPVGMKARGPRDVPYWPPTSVWNYKEVWLHPTANWLWIMADVYAARRNAGIQPDIAFTSNRAGNAVVLSAKAMGQESHTVTLRTYNLKTRAAPPTAQLDKLHREIRWKTTIADPSQPWIAVVIVDGKTQRILECTGWETGS